MHRKDGQWDADHTRNVPDAYDIQNFEQSTYPCAPSSIIQKIFQKKIYYLLTIRTLSVPFHNTATLQSLMHLFHLLHRKIGVKV